MTLLLCPVRPGDRNEELRYALRSWETNLHLSTPLELWTVGYCPSWLDPDRHIGANRYASAPFAVFDNIRLVSSVAAAAGRDDALYMNDDFFCLDPIGAVLPVKRNCTLVEHIDRFGDHNGLWWPRSLRLTAAWLAEQGFPHPDSYEVHRPLLASPERMSAVLDQWWNSIEPAAVDSVVQWRTVYGTLNKVDAYPVADAKLGGRTTGYGTPWVSTSDQSWPRYAQSIKARFQKPSRWER